MEKFKIGNLWVQFPFVPYAPQEDFMNKMMQAIQNAQNALLESPTGTGKSLCLLCASLGWLDMQIKSKEISELYDVNINNKDESDLYESSAPGDRYHQKYKIYFCTRTHSQLIQVVKEFQNTSYGHLRSSVLGSRKHLCLNLSAKRSDGGVDNRCRALRCDTKCKAPGPDIEDLPSKCTTCLGDHKCPYYVNYENMINAKEDGPFTQSGALDQKRLIEKCKEYKVCPFYVSRHLQKQADIVFLPYSYIFNPHILRGMQLNLKNSIIIIDEGHNLEKVCEENASFEMKASDVVNCRDEVLKALELYESSTDFPLQIGKKVMEDLVVMLKKLELIVKDRIKPGPQVPHYNGHDCLQFFEAAGFTRIDYHRPLSVLKELAQFLGGLDRKTDGIKKIHDVISTVYALDGDHTERGESILKESFVLYKEVVKPPQDTEKEPKIFFWCFDAGIIMKSLRAKGVRSFIVTSGTLSPLQPLKESLSIPFEVELLNKHIIEGSQVLSLCMDRAPNCHGSRQVSLEATFRNREENGNELYDALGNVVREVAKNSPKGLLIFFPSSNVKEKCLARWHEMIVTKNGKEMTLYDEINNLKTVFVEPKEAANLHDIQMKYNLKIKSSPGAILIGVLSGKVSEGIDFKDDLGRAVILVGLPYPPMFDPWVIYKKQHLAKKKGSEFQKAWYLSQAIRPVNQALGRIIRYQQDFGCVLLPDVRYLTGINVRNSLPKWLESELKPVDFENLGRLLRIFFSSITSKMKEINSKREKEQAETCCRHRELLKEEEYHPDNYLDLMKERDKEREKEEKLMVNVQEVNEAYFRKFEEVLCLRKQVADREAALRQRDEANQTMDLTQVQNEEYSSDCESGGESEWDAMTPTD